MPGKRLPERRDLDGQRSDGRGADFADHAFLDQDRQGLADLGRNVYARTRESTKVAGMG